MALALSINPLRGSEPLSLNMNEINPLLLCPLCNGYLVDAITISSCVHSFCRSCLFRHFQSPGDAPDGNGSSPSASASVDLEFRAAAAASSRSSHSRRSSTGSLSSSLQCPLCEKPFDLVNLHQDNVLQNLVYKLVPELHERETKRRQEFFRHSLTTRMRRD